MLKQALQSENDLQSALKNSNDLSWQANYPVALVHEERRIKEENVVTALKEKDFLDTKGYTKNIWSTERIAVFCEIAAKYVKDVSMLVHKGKRHEHFMFKEKRAQDYWKKVVDDGSFVATVEHSVYTESADICEIESDLRDLMRSSKEVPSLKEIGFIWIVEAPMNIEVNRVLAHYYQKNWMMVIAKEKTVYIGWHEHLGSVDMRHFVCPPNKK